MNCTHKNTITHRAFREGIIRELGYKLDELTDQKKNEIIKDIEENWWFCGGRDTRSEEKVNDDEGEINTVSDRVLKLWEELWRHYFGSRPMPDSPTYCVCRHHGLRYNCFITNGDDVIVIGRVCMTQFLPKQSKEYNDTLAKHCERCDAVHRNRKDNLCNECRLIVAEERKAEENRKKHEDERVRLEEERKRQEEERERLEELKWKRAHKCPCGGWKRPEYPECWNCRSTRLNSLSETQKKKILCQCGRSKKPQYAKCFTCNKSNSVTMD
jgi:hypothetical protein